MSDPFIFESCAIWSLLARIGVDSGPLTNPNSPGNETGIDVVCTIESKKIGAQMTVYHCDASSDARGSPSWNEEKKKNKATRGNYGMQTRAEYIEPLKYIVEKKVKRAGDFEYDKLDEV